MKTIYFLLIIIIIFSLEAKSQWVKQQLNWGGNGMFIIFFDENTGYIDVSGSGLISHLYKTTNAGTNWILKSTSPMTYNMCFLNDSTLIKKTYVGGDDALLKTTNSGLNWSVIYTTATDYIADIFFINELTGWISGRSENPTIAKVWRTTNGGNIFEAQLSQTGLPYFKGLFFDYNAENGKYWGFAIYNSSGKITTNSGETWTAFIDFPYAGGEFKTQFINRDTGFIANNSTSLFKTINGGLNWTPLNLPFNQYGSFGIKDFEVIHPDSIIYCVGAELRATGGIVWKTSNGGLNWLIQNIDTVNRAGHGWACDFINNNTGWITCNGAQFYKTTNGGGASYILKVMQTSTSVPDRYSLSQNFPNPFNPSTKINYEIKSSGFVTLKVFNLPGKEVASLVNEKQNAGSYAVDFNSTEFNLPSGIYFYTLNAGEFKETRKMVLIK